MRAFGVVIDMRWKVTRTRDEDTWFEDYVKIALSCTPPSMPSKRQRLGAVNVSWHQCEPGIAFITTRGGNPSDRTLARRFMASQLAGHGFKQAEYTFDLEDDDPYRKTAAWTDIMAKAKRLIQSGAVKILRNGYNDIVGQVVGDHGTYQTEITRNDPNSRAITGWQCDCPWDQFAWQRTRKWKKYEGRPCAHILASYWQALSTPTDEDSHPMMQGPPGGPPMPQPGLAPSPGPMPPQQTQMPPGQMLPGMAPMAPPAGMPPQPGMPPEILPPFPMEGMEQGPVVSIPGAKPQSPLNPVQYPGGTFSSLQEWDWPVKLATGFVNGVLVQTRYDDQGIWQGRSEAHGAGTYGDVPAGSVGEVLGQDPSGMVQILFMNPATGVNEHGKMEPWGISAWYLPSELVLRPDLKPPGPAIKRRV